MILGVIADDFTGAGDIASILADGGMATAVLTSVADIVGCDADAGVVALKTRSIASADAVARSLEALAALRAAGCRQFYFKYCSTFDSTPAGNIGPVAEALARELGARAVVVCPAFPANGRTLYQGNLFVDGVPLTESGMRYHPVTPMTDSDIRRWLRAQATGDVGHIALQTVREGEAAIAAALDGRAGLVVVDAIVDDDLRAIARAAGAAPLLTGGSALAMGLPAIYRETGQLLATKQAAGLNTGDALLLAGSCSIATREQVERYRMQAPAFALDVARLLAGDPVFDEARAFAVRHREAAPLIFSTAPPEALTTDDAAGSLIEATMAALARDAVGRGITRLVVAGGETSGAVTAALSPGALMVGRSIAPGVPSLHAGKLGLVLKSGNFGGADFFVEALAALKDGG